MVCLPEGRQAAVDGRLGALLDVLDDFCDCVITQLHERAPDAKDGNNDG